MNATSHFTHGIQPRNRLSLGVQRFALHVNSDSTHRVMNRRDFLAGVPGAFCHRLIVCVIRNEPEAILLLPCNSIVVLLNGSLEVCRLHTGFLGEFIKSRSFNHRTESHHIADSGTHAVLEITAGITQLIHHDPIRAAFLMENGVRQDIACCALTHKSLAVGINKDPIASGRTNVLHQPGARRAAGVQLNIGKTDQFSASLLCHEEPVTLSRLLDIGAADCVIKTHMLPNTGIHFLTECDICSKTAGCKDHAVFRLDSYLGTEVIGNDTDHTPAFILNQTLCRSIQKNLNFSIRISDHLFKHADIGIAGRIHRIM